MQSTRPARGARRTGSRRPPLSSTAAFGYRRASMRQTLSGIAIGALLSLLRAPLGIDLLQWPAVQARTAYGYRALALTLVALGLWGAGARSVSARWLLAVALGFALHGLVLANVWSPSSATSLWIAGLIACAVAAIAGRTRDELQDAAGPKEESTPFFTMLGIATAAAGVTLSIEALARHLRLFGGGLAQDDSVFGTVLLIGMAVGAGAFGWIVRARPLRGLALPVALSAAAAGGYAGLRVITSTATSRGLDQYLRAYGLDTSLHGMLVYDALLGASCFVVPALLAGAALSAVRTREELFSTLLGAAGGLAIVPSLLDADVSALATDKGIFSSQLIPLATFVGVSGAGLALLTLPGQRARARWTALVLALIPCSLPLVVAVRPQFVLSPWQSRPILPLFAVDTPEGLLTVEPSRGGLSVVTLNRRYLTPGTESVAVDTQRLLLAVEALAPARRVKRGLQVLLVGQLTPQRAQALNDADATLIDRSAAWSSAMTLLEEQMFGAMPLPAGEILSPAEARRRIDAGIYDLVIVPPVAGDAPVPVNLHAPDKTTVVAWLGVDEPLPRHSIGERVILSANGLDDPCLGIMLHASPPESAHATSIRVVSAGEPRAAPIPLRWLARRASDRLREGRAAAAERIHDAARGGPDEDLTAGLSIFYRAQVHSSPYESTDQQIELPAEALECFQRAALARPPDAFVRKLWEEIGRVLVGKRWIEEIYRYVEPIAAKHAPWPLLDHVLARADLEALDPDSAIARLSKLSELQPDHPEHWYYLGEAQLQAGRERDAAISLRRALELNPDNATIKRKLVVTLLHLGDPDGRRMADEMLRADPDDNELQSLLKGEQPDESPEAFTPQDGEQHDH